MTDTFFEGPAGRVYSLGLARIEFVQGDAGLELSEINVSGPLAYFEASA